MSTRSSRKSQNSRSRRKRRVVDFDVASSHSSNLSGFSSLPTPVPTPECRPKPATKDKTKPISFLAWKSKPDGRYNYRNGFWYEAPKPKYFWSRNNNEYEIIQGKLYSWSDH